MVGEERPLVVLFGMGAVRTLDPTAKRLAWGAARCCLAACCGRSLLHARVYFVSHLLEPGAAFCTPVCQN